MKEWILIISITMVSATILMFLSAFIAIPNEASVYYGVGKTQLLILYNSFNAAYLIISILLFPFLKRHYIKLVCISSVLITVGCVGRYLAGKNFTLALISTILVAISHVAIISAPYGLLKLFKPSHQGYAAAIPLFVPTIGVNYAIIYCMTYIDASSIE